VSIYPELCKGQMEPDLLCKICVSLSKRLNDEESVKKTITDLFYELWFAPLNTNCRVLARAMNIVDVVSGLDTGHGDVHEFFDKLFGLVILYNLNAKQTLQQSCKQTVDCLIENVLNMEQAKASTTNDRIVSCFSTLLLFSKITPGSFTNHVETMFSYLRIKPMVNHLFQSKKIKTLETFSGLKSENLFDFLIFSPLSLYDQYFRV
jgi:hypothetical protein